MTDKGGAHEEDSGGLPRGRVLRRGRGGRGRDGECVRHAAEGGGNVAAHHGDVPGGEPPVRGRRPRLLRVRRGRAAQAEAARARGRTRRRASDRGAQRHGVRLRARGGPLDHRRHRPRASARPLALRLLRARDGRGRGGRRRVPRPAAERRGVHRRLGPRPSRAHRDAQDGRVAEREVPRRLRLFRRLGLGQADGVRRARHEEHPARISGDSATACG